MIKTVMATSIIAIMGTAVLAAEATTTHMTAGAIQWLETPYGPQVAPVSGDFTKGKHVMLIKLKSGFKSPLHTHTASYTGIDVTGRSRHFEPGKPETETVMEPGAHWTVAGGVPHISECLAGEDCILAIYQDEAFDLIPAQ
jgi:hypothetical protein